MIDELATELKLDPVELRLRNYADKNPETGKPWSSKHLRDCYARGKAMIGWDARNPAPRAMREGSALVGYGMASTMYPAGRRPPVGARDNLRRRAGAGAECYPRDRQRSLHHFPPDQCGWPGVAC